MRELTDLERELLDADRWHDLACLRLDLLERLHARTQRMEAALVLTEDQRDKALKERDAAIAAKDKMPAPVIDINGTHYTYPALVASLRSQVDNLSSMKGWLLHQLFTAQATINDLFTAIQREQADLAAAIAERDAMRKQMEAK